MAKAKLTLDDVDVMTETERAWLYRLINMKLSNVLTSERDELREVSRKLHALDRAIDQFYGHGSPK